MDPTPTYVFEDGQVYKLVEGKVVTSMPEADFNGGGQMDSAGQGPLDMPPPPSDIQDDIGGLGDTIPCPECGGQSSPGDNFCPQCGAPLSEDSPGSLEPEGFDNGQVPTRGMALANVTTPNGLTGKVLGKVAGLWGEQVTVRLENGNIVHLPVHKDFKFASADEGPKEASVDTFKERLAATVEGDLASLKARHRELQNLQIEASTLVEHASDQEAAALNEIVVQATYERKEVEAALQHLAELEGQAFEPPAPFGIHVVEQASMGGGDASWLDTTMQEMVAEAAATDYDKLMNEGPEVFTAALDTVALAEAGATRSMASSWISEKTAAAEPNVRHRYMKVWLARVEEARRAELAHRKAQVQQKEAAVQEEDYSNLPDEFGFGV